jgi:hypothetical protein
MVGRRCIDSRPADSAPEGRMPQTRSSRQQRTKFETELARSEREAGSRRGLGAMTTDPDELNYLRVMLLKKRNQNSYWKWPGQPVEECGIASDILGEAGVNVAGMRSLERGQDPPDCEATLDGRFSGVEVTELTVCCGG